MKSSAFSATGHPVAYLIGLFATVFALGVVSNPYVDFLSSHVPHPLDMFIYLVTMVGAVMALAYGIGYFVVALGRQI
jgi:hypothetical protein